MNPVARFEQIFLNRLFGKVDADTSMLIKLALSMARIDLMKKQTEELEKELTIRKAELFPVKEELNLESSAHL